MLVASRENLRLVNNIIMEHSIGKVEQPLINCYFVIRTVSWHFVRQTHDAAAQNMNFLAVSNLNP